jgi:hypothetical protein
MNHLGVPTGERAGRREENESRATREIWQRSKSDPKFHRLLLAMLAALAAVPSKPKDQVAACALVDFTLKRAGTEGRRELRRRLKAMGEF